MMSTNGAQVRACSGLTKASMHIVSRCCPDLLSHSRSMSQVIGPHRLLIYRLNRAQMAVLAQATSLQYWQMAPKKKGVIPLVVRSEFSRAISKIVDSTSKGSRTAMGFEDAIETPDGMPDFLDILRCIDRH